MPGAAAAPSVAALVAEPEKVDARVRPTPPAKFAHWPAVSAVCSGTPAIWATFDTVVAVAVGAGSPVAKVRPPAWKLSRFKAKAAAPTPAGIVGAVTIMPAKDSDAWPRPPDLTEICCRV